MVDEGIVYLFMHGLYFFLSSLCFELYEIGKYEKERELKGKIMVVYWYSFWFCFVFCCVVIVYIVMRL